MSEEYLGIDLKIDPDTSDLVLDQVGEPETVSGTACLSQDLRHAISYQSQVLGFMGKDLQSGQIRDLNNLVEMITGSDPRVVKRSAQAKVLKADKDGLEIELTYQPIGSDKKENLVVRLGGF